LPQDFCALAAAPDRAVRCTGGHMLAFVPVAIDAYRQLAPRLWPVMQALVAHADRAGCCWPSVRRIADLTGVPRSTISRYLAALERDRHVSRTRKPGGSYTYRIAVQWLPSAVSHRRRTGVPSGRTEEQTGKKTGHAQARFAERRVSYGELPDDNTKWDARLRSWRQSRFWLPLWGPKPTEPGCFAPAELLERPSGAAS
jgi:hypothetical protein